MSIKSLTLGLAIAMVTVLLCASPVWSAEAQEFHDAVAWHQSRQLLRVEEKPVEGAAAGLEEKPKDVVDVDPKELPQAPDDQQKQEKLLGGSAGQETASLSKMDEGSSPAGGTGFTHGFVASLSMIIVSELGDKTFFIAAIMAMTHSRLTVLMGAIVALFAMTILSALVGYATTIIPRALTFYISSALFAIFGLKMLREGWTMSPDEGKEEYEEVQADLKRREDERHAEMEQEQERVRKIEKQSHTSDVESGVGYRSPGRQLVSGILSTVFLQALTMTFLAEWGDRSQIATIILGAREDVFGVIIGGCLGHFLCTGLAVLGGRFVAQRISVRTVTLLGGVVFLLFAVSALWIGPGE